MLLIKHQQKKNIFPGSDQSTLIRRKNKWFRSRLETSGKEDKAGSEEAKKGKQKWNLRNRKCQAIAKGLKSIWEKRIQTST